MAIQLQCKCGRGLTLRDELAGKVIRCPTCAGALTVPEPVHEAELVEEVAEVVDEAAAAQPAAVVQQKVAVPPPLPKGVGEVVEVEVVEEAVGAGPPPLRKRPQSDSDRWVDDDKRLEPKKKKKKKSVYSEMYGKDKPAGFLVFEQGWFGNGLIGGGAMMVVGLLLMLTMFLIGVINIYAFILAAVMILAGLFAMIKGLMDLYEE